VADERDRLRRQLRYMPNSQAPATEDADPIAALACKRAELKQQVEQKNIVPTIALEQAVNTGTQMLFVLLQLNLEKHKGLAAANLEPLHTKPHKMLAKGNKANSASCGCNLYL
jgi:hypothetical protein